MGNCHKVWTQTAADAVRSLQPSWGMPESFAYHSIFGTVGKGQGLPDLSVFLPVLASVLACVLQNRERCRGQCVEGLRERHLEGLVVHDHGQLREGGARLEVLLHFGKLVRNQALEGGQCIMGAISAALLCMKTATIMSAAGKSANRPASEGFQEAARNKAQPII